MRGTKMGLAKGAVFIAALLGASSGVMAAAGSVVTTVTPLAPVVDSNYTVTYSTDGTGGSAVQAFYVGYLVSFKNTGRNTITNVSFRGTTTVTDLQEVAVYDPESTEGWSCSVQPPTTSDNAVTVSCPLGTFAGRETKGPFVIAFKAPVKDTISPTLNDFVKFSGIVVQQEGFNGPNSWNNSIDSWSTADVKLGTSTPTNVTTFVPKIGGTFFTGTGSPPSVDDKITTRVTVPPIPNFSTANLFEEEVVTCPVNTILFATCTASRLTIPGTFSPYLTVVLRQDASTFKPTNTIPNIANAFVRYEGDLVGDCPSETTPLANGVPCIAKRTSTVVSSGSSEVCTGAWVVRDHGNSKDTRHPEKHYEWVVTCTPGFLNLSGYFEWVILNTKNGRFGID